jgi:Tol biopolymer transport system component
MEGDMKTSTVLVLLIIVISGCYSPKWYRANTTIIVITACLMGFVIEAYAEEKSIERIVSEKLVTKIEKGYVKDSIAISPDNRHVAYLAVEKKFIGGVKWFVVLDGKELKKYDSIGMSSLIFSPDSKCLAYVALSGKLKVPAITGSGYMRRSDLFDGEMFVVVDEKEGRHYNDIRDGLFGKAPDFSFYKSDPPVFSPNSKRVAYVAQEKEQKGLFVVSDEKEQKHYEWIGNQEEKNKSKTCRPIFSPDSSHIAYVVQEDKKVFVVVDGNDGKRYDDVKLVIFSPDSKHLAYVAKLGDKWVVVIDAKENTQYDGLDPLIFSPDSKHLAYRAQKGKEMLVVLDGEEGKLYNTVSNPIFSPDSKHWAYLAQEGNKFLMVVDRKEGKKYAKISFSPRSLFSPDSERVVYGVQTDNGQFVVLFDETESEKHYDRVDDFIFSPDSKHFAYTAVMGNKWFVVVDGKEQKKYDEVPSLIFSPDSKHLAYVAFRDKKQFVVLDGVEGKQYDGIFKVGGVGIAKFIFDSPDALHYLAVNGNSLYLVEEIIK